LHDGGGERCRRGDGAGMSQQQQVLIGTKASSRRSKRIDDLSLYLMVVVQVKIRHHLVHQKPAGLAAPVLRRPEQQVLESTPSSSNRLGTRYFGVGRGGGGGLPGHRETFVLAGVAGLPDRVDDDRYTSIRVPPRPTTAVENTITTTAAAARPTTIVWRGCPIVMVVVKTV
jgi:hypothetical protein